MCRSSTRTLTEPVGIVDRDRFSAIRAVFGAEIPTVPVTQDTTALDTGNQRLGARTDVVGPTGTPLGRRLFADIAVGHSFTNINQTFDQIGPGSTGPFGPAKNSTDASADSVMALMNSAFANIANRIPPYSVR